MNNWTWLLIGLGAGYLLSRGSGGVGGGFSVSAGFGARGAPPGSGAVPLDQPTGSEPYQMVGPYNPYIPSTFSDLIDNGANARIIETDRTGRDYLQ